MKSGIIIQENRHKFFIRGRHEIVHSYYQDAALEHAGDKAFTALKENGAKKKNGSGKWYNNEIVKMIAAFLAVMAVVAVAAGGCGRLLSVLEM